MNSPTSLSGATGMLAGRLEETLDKIIQRHDELRDTLASGERLEGNDYARMSKEFSSLADIVAAVNDYRQQTAELEDLDSIIGDAGSDAEVKNLFANMRN